MNKTKIEWTNFSVNPIKGLCPVDCKDNQGKPYCYARRLYLRFRWYPVVRYEPSVFSTLGDVPPGGKVFVGSTHELFLPQYEAWTRAILRICGGWEDRTFQFLTKQPQNLAKWSPFPDNCWVGVSVTANGDMTRALTSLANIKATVRFLSFEPLLGQIGMRDHISMKGIVDWVTIGAQTPSSPKTASIPRIEWVEEIVEAADRAGIPVFLKNNLTRITSGETWAGKWVEHENQPPGEEIWWHPRQEFPVVQERLKP